MNEPHAYPGHDASDEEIDAARTAALTAILEDDAWLKVIAAGPGTGKTYTFDQVIRETSGRALVLTFLRNLVDDLQLQVGARAEVYSFHGFAKQQLYVLGAEGVTREVDYYPAIEMLYEEDLLTTDSPASGDQIADAFMNVRLDGDVLPLVLRSGDYYNAVGHTDAVYRVFRTLQNDPRGVPAYSQVLVDEYQDFSLLEVELINLLATASRTLIVGDDDQALYEFRHASPEFIRDLVARGEYKSFDLPYCSRCTEVLVDATHRVVHAARHGGLLVDRIAKPYYCYLPGKRPDSERYPGIVHARCSVDSNRAPYMARYIERRINDIDAADIEESRSEGDPTVLIIGKKQFTNRISRYLSEAGFDVSAPVRPRLETHVLDGYRRLAANERSRLGWRILLHCLRPDGWPDWVATALLDEVELVDLIEPAFRERHLVIAAIVRELLTGRELDDEEVARVEAATDMSIDEVRRRLAFAEEAEETSEMEAASQPGDGPTIMVTSLVSSKGLQGQHVFLVGVNGGHLPRDSDAVEEHEVCELLVALTRARKSCTLVSCRNFAGTWLEESIFINWLRPLLDEVEVDKEYLR